MNDDANAHYEDEVNGKVDKIGFEEDATDKSKKCHYFAYQTYILKTRIADKINN